MSNITPLAVFEEKDVFPGKESKILNVKYEVRLTGKVVIFNEKGEVALLGNKVNSFFLLPGGGIDDHESLEQGLVREALEETGYHIILKEKIGLIEDFRPRDKKHCLTYCYTASTLGDRGEQKLTSSELENGAHIVWFSLEKAIEILKEEVLKLRKGEVAFYNTGFNILRDHMFLEKVREMQ